jgi:hypothetical protein
MWRSVVGWVASDFSKGDTASIIKVEEPKSTLKMEERIAIFRMVIFVLPVALSLGRGRM